MFHRLYIENDYEIYLQLTLNCFILFILNFNNQATHFIIHDKIIVVLPFTHLYSIFRIFFSFLPLKHDLAVSTCACRLSVIMSCKEDDRGKHN